MPVGRVLLKSISDSKKISRLKTDTARLLYTWLISHLDINGCFSGDPQVVGNKILTRLNISIVDVEKHLKDLEDNNLIMRYETNGDVFLIVPDFIEKQPSLNANREGKPTIPLPTKEQLEGKPEAISEELIENIESATESEVNIISVPPEQRPVTKNDKDDVKEIFEHWNLLEIVTHRALGNSMTTSITARLKNYSKEEIKRAMSNYKEVIESPDTYWEYKWPLQDFLSRGEGKNIDRFLDLKVAMKNFGKKGQQGGVKLYD